MRKHYARIALLCGALAALGACSHKTTVMTSQGAATIDRSNDGKSVTITTSHGTVSIDKDVDPSKLGAPVYPNATSVGSFSGTSQNGSGSLATFTTKDAFENVYQFYKSKLPAGAEKMKMASGGTQMAVFSIGDDKSAVQTTVTITAEKDTTTIQIAHGTKAPGASN